MRKPKLAPELIAAIADALDIAYSDQSTWLDEGDLDVDGYSPEDRAGKAELYRNIGRAAKALGIERAYPGWESLAEQIEGDAK